MNATALNQGSRVGRRATGQHLLALSAVLMIATGVVMLAAGALNGDDAGALSPANAPRLALGGSVALAGPSSTPRPRGAPPVGMAA